MASQFRKIALRQQKKLLQVAKETTRTMADTIIEMSPVDTGRFKENWHTEINKIDFAIDDLKIPKAFLNSKLAMLKIGDSIFFTNSLDYAKKLEFGFSKKAPLGMVRITVANYNEIVNAAILKVKSKKR